MSKLLLANALFLTLLILVASLVSPTQIAKTGVVLTASDKTLHALSYFVLTLGWLLYVISVKKRKAFHKEVLKVAFGVFAFGIVIEILQGTVTQTRTAEFLDVLANGLGVFAALFLIYLFRQIRTNHKKNKN